MENESFFNLIYRLNNSSILKLVEQPDSPIINEKGITVIDWKLRYFLYYNQYSNQYSNHKFLFFRYKLSDSDAINKYLNRLIIKNFKRYLNQIKEDNELNQTKSKTKKLKISMDEFDNEPLITIFDNFLSFNELELIKFTNQQDEQLNRFKLLNRVERLNESNNLLFYITLRNYFTNQLNTIKDRLLIIIYLNENYFEKFLNFLINKQFYFHIIIITFKNLPIILRKNFNNFKNLDYLKITNSLNDTSIIEIKKYDKNQYKDVQYDIKI